MTLSNTISDRLKVPSGGAVLLIVSGGYVVTAGTGDQVIINGIAGDTFELRIIGQAPAA